MSWHGHLTRLVLLLVVPTAGPSPQLALSQPTTQRQEASETARQLLQSGRSQQAATLFAELLAEHPEDPALMEGRVRALLAQELWQQALGEARRFHEQHPNAGRVRGALGEALFRAGLLEEAELLLEEQTGRSDPPARSLMTLGRLMDARGREGQAIELMRRAVAAEPEDRTVLYWAAQAAASDEESIDLLERYLARSNGDDADRIESARATLQGLRALGEQPSWIVESRPARLEIPLELLWYPGSGQPVGFLVAARLGAEDGKPVRMLLDSGSPGLYVVERVARKKGFSAFAQMVSFGGGGSGRHTTQKGFFPSLAIGGLRFTRALASSTKHELEPLGRYHGVLGLGIFNGYRITLDLPRKRLVLEPPQSGSENEGSPYWMIEGQFLVRAKLKTGKEGLFLFDTGSTRTVLARSFVDGVQDVWLGTPVSIHAFGGMLAGARALHGTKVIFQQLECGPYHLRAADLSLRSRLGGVEVSGFLGLDLLANARLVIDTERRRIAATAVP